MELKAAMYGAKLENQHGVGRVIIETDNEKVVKEARRTLNYLKQNLMCVLILRCCLNIHSTVSARSG